MLAVEDLSEEELRALHARYLELARRGERPSRSALEEHKLSIDALKMTLGELGPDDQFARAKRHKSGQIDRAAELPRDDRAVARKV